MDLNAIKSQPGEGSPPCLCFLGSHFTLRLLLGSGEVGLLCRAQQGTENIYGGRGAFLDLFFFFTSDPEERLNSRWMKWKEKELQMPIRWEKSPGWLMGEITMGNLSWKAASWYTSGGCYSKARRFKQFTEQNHLKKLGRERW